MGKKMQLTGKQGSGKVCWENLGYKDILKQLGYYPKEGNDGSK